MSKDNSSKIKIFVGYAQPNIIFKSEVYQPILTSSAKWNNKDIIKDNTGINIADRNKYYGELSGHYWVWKNFVPETDLQYIGLCHYRRFLDFNFTKTPEVPFTSILNTDFQKKFTKYTEKNILKCIEGYDIILPQKMYLNGILHAQYLRWHPTKDMNLALNILRDNHPEYIESAKQVMGSNEIHLCLNFIMKKELFIEYMEWIFDILFELEKRTNWEEYTEYRTIRTPALIAERFFNIWLFHNIKKKKLKALKTTSFMLTGEGYGSFSHEDPKKSYESSLENFSQELKI